MTEEQLDVLRQLIKLEIELAQIDGMEQGMISAPELLRIATELDVAEDDIDLFHAQ